MNERWYPSETRMLSCVLLGSLLLLALLCGCGAWWLA